MMNKNKIYLIVFITFLLGIISTFFPSAKEELNDYFINKLLAPLNLSFFAFSFFEETKYLNFFFYVLLLISGILFIKSKQTEIRLIRFVFAIIFLDNILLVINRIVVIFFYNNVTSSNGQPMISQILLIIANLIWIYISYYLISIFKNCKTLKTNIYETNSVITKSFVEATATTRFWHLLIDLIICMLILSKHIALLGENFYSLSDHYGEMALLYVLILVFRIIYYMIYETLFNKTPAKFLTETRVTNELGEKVSSITILGRTLARFVPFEPFSFLGYSRWHDRWSKTYVIIEENGE